MKNTNGRIKTSQPGLSQEARKWHDDLKKAYSIHDEAGLILLRQAAESFDRMRAAQRLISENGITYKDRYGQPKLNPACTVERDTRSQMLLCLKQLNLDLDV